MQLWKTLQPLHPHPWFFPSFKGKKKNSNKNKVIKEKKRGNFKGKHAASGLLFFTSDIFARSICNCFIVLCRFLTAKQLLELLWSFLFLSLSQLCTYKLIQKEILLVWSWAAQRFTLYSRMFNFFFRFCLFKLVYFNWDSICADCQLNLFSFRLFKLLFVFCLRGNLFCQQHELVAIQCSHLLFD